MMCCDSFSSRHLQPPSVLGILTFVTTRSRACAEREDQQALVTDEERVRDDHLVPGGYRNIIQVQKILSRKGQREEDKQIQKNI